MEKIYTLVRERKWEEKIWVDTFTFTTPNEKEMTNPEIAIRNAEAEFLRTKDGRHQRKKTSNDYNWGDFISSVSNEILEKYGLKPVQNSVYSVVDQDEVLCSDCEDEFEVGEVVEVRYRDFGVNTEKDGSIFVYIDEEYITPDIIEGLYRDKKNIIDIGINKQEEYKELALKNPVSKLLGE